MFNALRQNIVILITIVCFLALSFAGVSAESIQTSKKSTKASSTPKKPAKGAPTPNKKAQAKATPTPKKPAATAKAKPADKKAAGKKAADKKAADKRSTAKTDSKKQTSRDKNQKESSKTSGKTDKNGKTSKSTAVKSTAKTDPKSKDSKTAKNSGKTVNSRSNSGKSEMGRKTAPPTARKPETARKTETKPAAVRPRQKIETPPDASEAPQVMVTDLSALIRSQARSNSSELSKVKLGTVLDVSQKNASWYKVEFSNGPKTSTGWIAANSVGSVAADNKGQVYNQIVGRYYRPDGMDFGTASTLYEFLTRNQSDFEGSDSAADLQLKRLLALRAALKNISAGEKNSSPYREFLKAHEKEIAYSEPSGEYLVVANLFWDLHKKYKDSPLADQIAWEGAQNPLPGECEGYVNCHLFYARMTSGEYLSLHPNGKKSLEALTNLTNMLDPIAADLTAKQIYTGPTDVTDRAEFNNLIAELRTIVSRLGLTEKEKPLQQLKRIAEGFR